MVDICLNGIHAAVPFDGQGELLRTRCEEAVQDFPLDHIFHFRLASGQHMCGRYDAALESIDTALARLPATGSRGSHMLLQEQYLSRRDTIQEARLRARRDAEHQRRLEEREAENQRRWERLEAELQHRWEQQEQATRVLQETTRSSAVRAVEVVAVFTAAIAFAVGSLQVTLNGSLALRDRLWLLTALGAGLAVFALLVIGGTWLITRSRER